MQAELLNGFVLTGIAEQVSILSFAEPAWLWLILLWPLLWLLSSLSLLGGEPKDDLSEAQSQHNLQVKHPLIHRLKIQSVQRSKGQLTLTSFAVQLLRGVMIFLLAITLANPVEKLPTPSQPESKTVRDIAFVIETSASFMLPDYAINGQNESRMNVVKQVLDQFIAGLSGNRFSLTIYAEQAFTMLPMTYDATLTRLTLKRLKPYLAGRTDIAMGEALGLALKQTDEQLAKNPNLSQLELDQQARKKVIVLISDGLSLPSRLALTEAVNYSQLLQVPIYTIGIGASTEQADNRQFTGLIYQPLESESLIQLAQQTQGQYFQVGSGAEIKAVLQKINEFEGVPFIPPPSAPQIRALLFYPLGLLLVIMLFYWLSLLFIKPSNKSGSALMNSAEDAANQPLKNVGEPHV